jgi:hypothetical protein
MSGVKFIKYDPVDFTIANTVFTSEHAESLKFAQRRREAIAARMNLFEEEKR